MAKSSVAALFDEALSHHQARRFAEAERLYLEVLALDAQHVDSLHLLGAIALHLGQLDAAAERVAQAIRLRDVPDYHNTLGNVFKDQGRLEEAVAEYQKALAGDPNYPEAHVNLGSALRRLGKSDEAVAHYEQALTIAPDFAEAHYNLANVLKEQGRLDDAAGHYRRALAIHPNFAEAHNNLGIILKDQGRLDDAVEQYEKALAIKADSVEFHYNLSLALIDQGKMDAAAAHLERCLKLNPADRQGAQLLLAGMGKLAMPGRMPEAHLQHLYARRAGVWDKEANLPQAYRGHGLVVQAFDRLCGKGQRDILDAGCGTGLVGELLRGRARRLEGVDLSLPMLQQAQAKGVYDKLYQDDLVALMTRMPEQYDVITCAATLIHFGDLSAPLRAAAMALRDNGLFLCTLFPNEKNDIGVAPLNGLAQGGCYAHGRNYIARVSEQNNLSVEFIDTGIHEYLQGQPVTSLVVALRRRARIS